MNLIKFELQTFKNKTIISSELSFIGKIKKKCIICGFFFIVREFCNTFLNAFAKKTIE